MLFYIMLEKGYLFKYCYDVPQGTCTLSVVYFSRPEYSDTSLECQMTWTRTSHISFALKPAP